MRLGDHGFHLGEHRGLWRKDTLFEEALRSPLIIAGTSVQKPGAPTASLVELVDLYPTLVQMAGLPAVPGLDGKSLMPLVRDLAASVRSSAVSLRRVRPPGRAFSLRRGRWRYTLWPDGSEDLHDVDQPPPSANHARRPEHVAAMRELRALLTSTLEQRQ